MPAIWWLTPRQSIAAECGRRGKAAVVAGCIDLLQGRQDTGDALLIALAGPAAQAVLDGSAGGRPGYWPRVWAARGLLHAWDDSATAGGRPPHRQQHLNGHLRRCTAGPGPGSETSA